MKHKSFQIVIATTRQSVSYSALTEQFIPDAERPTAAARAAVDLFWRECHGQEEEQPGDFGGRAEWLCRHYDVTTPELLRSCIAWRAGWMARAQ